jgi:hypothetical protein
MTVYQHAVAAVAESADRGVTAGIYRVFYGFDLGTLLSEVELFARELVAA